MPGTDCDYWANDQNKCNDGWVKENCKKSCGLCADGE